MGFDTILILEFDGNYDSDWIKILLGLKFGFDNDSIRILITILIWLRFDLWFDKDIDWDLYYDSIRILWRFDLYCNWDWDWIKIRFIWKWLEIFIRVRLNLN